MPEDATTCRLDDAGRCITCSDEGLTARVLAVTPEQFLAVVEAEGRQMEIATDLVGPVAIGQSLLVHAGVALAHLSGDDG